MELNIFTCAAALVVAALLTWLILRFFFGERKGVAGEMREGVQEAVITVRGGYAPDVVTMRAGVPITLHFDRQETGECTSHVMFGDLGLDAMLPGNASTDVHLPALPAGDYPFACGMNMVHGLLRVEGDATGEAAVTGAPHAADGFTRPAAQSSDYAADEAREAEERRTEIRDLTRLVAIGAVLTLPVFAVMMIHMADHMLLPGWLTNPWWQAILITPVMFYCGAPIHRIGFPALLHRSPDMNSLVSLGTGAAYLYSLLVCIAPGLLPAGSREPYFESVGVVITLVLVGRLLETKAREGTGRAVRSLIKLRPRTAHVLASAASADAGTSHVNGGADAASYGNWLNPADWRDDDIDDVATGSLIVVKAGERVPVDGVVVDGEAQVDESMITGESEPVAKRAGDTLTGATITLRGNLLMRATQVGDDTVLSQIVAMVGRAQATKAPVQRLADRIARIFVPVVFIIAIWTFAIWLALGPDPKLAHALVTAVSVLIIACPCALGLATPLSVTAATGVGATNGVLVTSAKALERAREIGTVVFDKTGTITRGVADADSTDWSRPSYERDPVKAGSKEAVAVLHAAGVRTVMLSGDKADVAAAIAREVGIDTVIAQVRPDGKAYWIERLQAEPHNGLVAMVGDGINDAPALAQADLGFAIGTGTDVAMQSADVTLMSGDLRGVIRTIGLSQATMRNIRQNLGWAFGYNVIGIPIAAGVLYPFTGWLLSPMIAGLAMALSSVCLVLNANRLNGVVLRDDALGAGMGPGMGGAGGKRDGGATAASSAATVSVRGASVRGGGHDSGHDGPRVIIDERTTLTGGTGGPAETTGTTETTNTSTNTKENTMEMNHMHHDHMAMHHAPTEGETATDPVCGMTVAVNADAITREHDGRTYYFCGEHCAKNFDKAPQVFLG